MPLPMKPEVYMCYIISAKYGDIFQELAYKWNKEFKTYRDDGMFRGIRKNMKVFRKKHWNTPKARGWNTFNVDDLMEFINEHLNWERK